MDEFGVGHAAASLGLAIFVVGCKSCFEPQNTVLQFLTILQMVLALFYSLL